MVDRNKQASKPTYWEPPYWEPPYWETKHGQLERCFLPQSVNTDSPLQKGHFHFIKSKVKIKTSQTRAIYLDRCQEKEMANV